MHFLRNICGIIVDIFSLSIWKICVWENIKFDKTVIGITWVWAIFAHENEQQQQQRKNQRTQLTRCIKIAKNMKYFIAVIT